MRAGGYSKISNTVQGVNRSGQALALKPELDHKFKFNSSTKRIKTNVSLKFLCIWMINCQKKVLRLSVCLVCLLFQVSKPFNQLDCLPNVAHTTH